MSSKRSSRRAKLGRDQRSLVAALDGPEAKRLLESLLDARPELLGEIAARADAKLASVTVEDVTEEVACAVGELRVEDVWERSGAQSDGEYVEPSEAAWTVIEEAVSPFLEDLGRRIELGREGEAVALCQGMLLGLYRVSEDFRSRGQEFLGGYGADCIGDTAGFVLETWMKGGTRARSRGARRPRNRTAMQEFVWNALPEWRSFLSRVLVRERTRPNRR